MRRGQPNNSSTSRQAEGANLALIASINGLPSPTGSGAFTLNAPLMTPSAMESDTEAALAAVSDAAALPVVRRPNWFGRRRRCCIWQPGSKNGCCRALLALALELSLEHSRCLSRARAV